MVPEDDGTTGGTREARPYTTLLIACVVAAASLGARFVSHVAHEALVAKSGTTRLAGAHSRRLLGGAS